MDGPSRLVKLRGLENLGLKGFLQQIFPRKAIYLKLTLDPKDNINTPRNKVDLWGASSASTALRFRITSNLLESKNPIFQPPTPHPPGQGFGILSANNDF